ncbi:PhnA domain-containing protein [Methylocystis sp.]|uniref:PhnA domain-containing protein n=1 Tax=Methylocystis sp. TaxID=1911079 RepID=UPI0025E6E02D|nr:PhnA domain-containing protein [Methylocystis sp.]
MTVRDSNGVELKDGDSVTLKRGTLIRNIRLTDDDQEIECRAEKIKGLVLRTEFLKKA